MRDAFQTRILAVALAVATLGVCVLAGFNLSQELGTEFPTDGVVWVEAQGGLRADRVPADSPAAGRAFAPGTFWRRSTGSRRRGWHRRCGRCTSNGIYDHAATLLDRSSAAGDAWPGAQRWRVRRFPVQVYLEPADRSTDQGSRLIALVYLLIGLYVLFRRWTAPKSTAFLCLLPGVVCAVCVPVDGRAGVVRPGDLLGQPDREYAAAGAVPALRGELLGRGRGR